MKKLYGVITAMTTPFDSGGKVDVKAVEALTNYLIGKGVNCLYPCGTTGEMFLMTAEERKLVSETVVKTAGGRATVFIHTGAMHPDETVELSLHAVKIGADGVGVVTPVYFNMTDKGMVDYYKFITSKLPGDFPVYAYVIPQLAGNDITPAVMDEIVKACPNVTGVKYSYADMQRLREYLYVNGGNFSVVFGADRLFLPALIMGCDGTVSGCSGPVPEPFVDIYKYYLSGDIKKAAAAQKIAGEIVDILKAGEDMSIFKEVLTFRGIPGGHMRRPLSYINEEEKEALRKDIQKYL